MVKWIRENSPAKLEGLWKAVLPEGATAPPAEYAADLFWLLQQGQILLYTDDTLVVQEPTKPPEPKKPKAPKKKAEPAAQNPTTEATPEATAEATEDQTDPSNQSDLTEIQEPAAPEEPPLS
jgi:outer membrane biosynthesis protein TonB